MRRLLEIFVIVLTMLVALGFVAFCIYSPVTFMWVVISATCILIIYSVIQMFK